MRREARATADRVVSTIWPDKTDTERAQLAAALAMVQGQIDVNRTEAGSSSPFTSGWRPFIGGTCGIACGWNWIGLPVTAFVCAFIGHPVALLAANVGEMMPLLLGMLGLGGLRTYEKVKGVAS